MLMSGYDTHRNCAIIAKRRCRTLGKTKRWKWKQAVFLAGVLLCVICTTCTGCGERAQAEEQGELVRKEAVGEIRQPLSFCPLYASRKKW